jgi:hypothetical protein
MERYPQNTIVTLDDFRKCGWQEAISESRRDQYSSMWQSLSTAATYAIEEKRLSEGKVLWLLADACSMTLMPSSLNEPFKPIMMTDGKRSALPEDFQTDDIAFFSEIIPEITDPKLCARISDITWLMTKPKNPVFALSAIDNYRRIPISTESWIRDGRDCWERAIRLCMMLRTGAGARFREIEKILIDCLKTTATSDGYLALWIVELLAKNGQGGNDQIEIAQKLEAMAIQFEEDGDLQRSRDYFDGSADWYKKAGSDEKFVEMTIRNAEGWVKEAIARQASDKPSQIVAFSFYENAIQKYRTIPKASRATHNVNVRIAELRNDMNTAGENSVDEMGVISSGPIDITQLIEKAIESVQGKSALDALFALANIYRGTRVEEIREFSKKMIKKHPLQAFFSSTHMSRDGRVIAKRQGLDIDSKDNEETIWADMVKHYMMELGLVVQGYIWPGLEVLRQEHRIKEIDFYSIVRQSPIVPPGREGLLAKALFLGYDNDFVTALHILVPQIEHIVRFHLKQAGAKTTTLDAIGIEHENGLSALMEHEATNKIFGVDLAFELKALFCDQFGPNLRNEVAHGLISHEDSASIYSIYAWCLCLRIILNTFRTRRQRQQEDAAALNKSETQND